ncbi:phage terminase small subunit P27 family [Palleronia pelagia]|uniref:Phage terminase, small subunit, putative, P27 family n=1 Tax=Palleronia pelagia TaxID=387096 RepID=A0A1H8AI19_9RHOB|nr:phage terminase small subunit P27 family [Palleronia pelagia]SEM69478.1 phage terminase, small subunit, putative, P27 family [Palleronia pelagia]
MMRGRKPRPDRKSLKDTPLAALPRCPPHLSKIAQKEWRRLATPLFDAGIVTLADRAALAAYCQAYGRWVEAEERLKETPPLLKAPSGYVQQSPWLSVANKQLELMGRYMGELGLTPAARSRIRTMKGDDTSPKMEFVMIYEDGPSQAQLERDEKDGVKRHYLDARL